MATSRSALRVSVPLWLLILCASVAIPTPIAIDAQTPPQVPAGLKLRIGVEKPGGGRTLVTLPIEIYVARVLAGEAARNSPPAALEALAMTIRTFATANRGRHQADGFDLCDQTHCQVMRTATPETERAAQATSSLVLMRDGIAAQVFYSASCGGHTEIPSNVWPGSDDPPFLPARDDDGCAGAPAWTAELSEVDLARALRSAGFRGDRLRELRVLSHNESGRVARLTVDGFRPDQISGQDLRVAVGRTLGWQHIKSTAFDLKQRSGVYRFSGHGSGHGVGLCVIGSVGLATRGSSAAAILARYFPGLAISNIEPRLAAAVPQPRVGRTSVPDAAVRVPAGAVPGRAPAAAPMPAGVLVSLPDDDEGERVAVARLAARARDDLSRALALSSPAAVTLRFHPTTDDYERATGHAWFTSGAFVAGELHLLPLAILREQDMLERTIRHELVHAMTDDVLGKRPVWVREGAAIYFAGEGPIPGEPPQKPRLVRPEPRAACPTDSELLRPVSIGALSNAYAQARACFARQIAAGKAWRDVK